MKNYYSDYKAKKSTKAAAVAGGGVGIGIGALVGGAIIIPTVIAAVLCPFAGLAAGAYFAGAAVMANTAWGMAAAVGIGVVGAYLGYKVGGVAGAIVGTVGSVVGTVAGAVSGAVAGAVVGGLTKGIGAAAEGIFGLNRKRRGNKAANAKAVLPTAAPAVQASSAFKATDVKAQFVAANAQPGDDNKVAAHHIAAHKLAL
jgi:hypothetical protein